MRMRTCHSAPDCLYLWLVSLWVCLYVCVCMCLCVCSWFRSPLSLLLFIITVFVIICVSLWCFTDKVEKPCTYRTYICTLEPHRNLGWGFARVKRLSPYPSLLPVVFLLFVPRRFLCCSSSMFVLRWFHMWRLFCHYLFLISPLFGASGAGGAGRRLRGGGLRGCGGGWGSRGLGACVVIVSGFLHLFFVGNAVPRLYCKIRWASVRQNLQ